MATKKGSISTPVVEHLVNLNVGVLGHVDSGKTSLVKALSTHLSTASLDKHPQSRERGITLDLGFSSFLMPLPTRIGEERSTPQGLIEGVQITLVDCPGHASLIRTIIGGAQIIDIVILVIDVTHGVQAQTVECVIIAEICANDMIIVLNKVDMLPEAEREKLIEQQKCNIRKNLRGSKFADAPMVCVAAAVGEKVAALKPHCKGSATGGEKEGGAGPDRDGVVGIADLYKTLEGSIRIPQRCVEGPLFLAVDHCFPIRGQVAQPQPMRLVIGTVLTGTVLSGQIGVNDMIELPTLGEQRKVKSMQMFHQSVKKAKQGDRLGVCVTNLDAKAIERGVICTPGSIRPVERAIAVIRKVRAFRGNVRTGCKMHISVGHSTVMARVIFFGAEELKRMDAATSAAFSSSSSESGQGGALAASLVGAIGKDVPRIAFNREMDYVYQEEMRGKAAAEEEGSSNISPLRSTDGASDGGESVSTSEEHDRRSSSNSNCGDGGGCKGGKGNTIRAGRFQPQYVLLEFESALLCPIKSLIIGSRLDGEAGSTLDGGGAGGACRIAFYGTLIESLKEEEMRRIRIYKEKMREGSINRLGPPSSKAGEEDVYHEVTGQGLFKRETDLTAFIGMRIETKDGQVGRIESGFGKTGKFKVNFPSGVRRVRPGDKLYLRFQRFVYDTEKKMVQKESLMRLHRERLDHRMVASSSSSSSSSPSPSSSKIDLAPSVPPTSSLPSNAGQGRGVRLSSLGIGAAEEGKGESQSKEGEEERAAAAGSVLEGGYNKDDSSEDDEQWGEGVKELRYGEIDAIKPGSVVIAKGLFSMEEDIKRHVGLRVITDDGIHEGHVLGPFGKGGKAKVQFSPSFDGTTGTKLTIFFRNNPIIDDDAGGGGVK